MMQAAIKNLSNHFRSIIAFEIFKICSIALSGILAYMPMLSNGFVTWDTAGYVLQNTRIQQFSWENFNWMLTSYYMSNWHPVTWLSHALDYQLYGLDPVGHHVTNLVIHIANSLILYAIARIIFDLISTTAKTEWTATLVALLYAVHPQHVESVAWVAQRKDLLCAFFFLAAVYCYLRHNLSAKGRSRWYSFTVISTAMALLSKPMAVTLPFVLLLLDIYPLGRSSYYSNRKFTIASQKSIANLVFEKWPFILMALMVSIIAFTAQYFGGSVASMEKVGLVYRFLNAANSLFLYISKFLFPINLSPFYQFPPYLAGDMSLQSLVPIFGFASVSMLVLWLWYRKQYYWLIAWLYYLITLLPVIGLIQIGDQAAADRYTYLPMISFYFISSAGICKLLNYSRFQKRIFATSAVMSFSIIICLLLIVLTRQQSLVWRNDLVFWRYTALQAPASGLVRGNYGRTLWEVDQFPEAIKQLKVAAVLRQSAVIQKWLGDAYLKLNELETAKQHFMLSLQLNADKEYVKSVELYTGLAIITAKQGNIALAQEYLAQAIRLDPSSNQVQQLVKNLGFEK